MTPQLWIGVTCLATGILFKTLAGFGVVPDDVHFVGELTNIGAFFIGKEKFEASPMMQEIRASKRPPPFKERRPAPPKRSGPTALP